MNNKYSKGQSMAEIMIALALFTTIGAALVSLVVGSFRGVISGGDQTQAEALAQEGIEAVRGIRDRAWNELQYNQSAVASNSNGWVFVGEGTSQSFDKKFQRTIKVQPVCRNALDDISACPASYTDPHMKEIYTSISWQTAGGQYDSLQRAAYVSNWDSDNWIQSDWSGGSGQNIWSDVTQYASDNSNVEVTASSGNVLLKSIAGGSGDWHHLRGRQFLDDTDSEFNLGTYSNTVASGSGSTAKVVLTRNTNWNLHASSVVTTATANIRSADVVSATDIWAVGDGGSIFHYDGTIWTQFADYSGFDFLAIDMVSATDGWAVGTTGRIYRYQNGAWELFVDTGTQQWNSVSMVSASDGFVVANGGTIYRWNGATWSNIASPFTNNMNDVQMMSATDGWISADSGRFARWNGVSWTQFVDLGGQRWRALHLRNATDGWAVDNAGRIGRWNGATWSQFTDTGAQIFLDVYTVSATDAWAVANNGQVYRWGGVSWALNSSTNGSSQWDAIAFIDASNIFIMDTSATFYRWTGSWASFATPVSMNFNAVHMVSTTDGWAVGNRGNIYRYNGTTWTLHTDTGNTNFYGLYMVSATDGWAVGDSGAIYRWNGATWSLNTDTGAETWRAVFMIASNNGFAVGMGGNIRRWNGASWSVVASGTSQDLYSVHGTSATNIWAVGNSGTILLWSGASWALNVDTGSEKWNDVYMSSTTDGWVVGDGGNLRRYNGSTWSVVSSSTSANINSVHYVDASNSWAVGASGKILKWNGSAWSTYQTVASGDDVFRSVYLLTTKRGFAVGDRGIIYELDNNFNASGTLTSRVFDTGSGGTVWDIAEWIENLPAGSNVTIATRTGNVAVPDGSWSAWSAELTTPTGSTITSAAARYIQYRLTLTRPTDPNTTPYADIVLINYSRATSNDFDTMHCSATNNCWAVGSTGDLVRWNGTSWTLNTNIGVNLNGIYVLSASDAWAVGYNGKIYKWNGTTWSEFTDTGAETWRNVHMVSATDGWVIGDGGNIRRYNGTSWNVVASPTAQNLQALYMLSATDGWAVGASGVIIRWNGTTWSLFIDTGAQDRWDVHMLSSTLGWTVATDGSIYRWNGTTWSLFQNTGAVLWSLTFVNSNLGYTFGDTGTIYSFDGATWTTMTSPTTANLYGSYCFSSGECWADGTTGDLIHINTSSGGYQSAGILQSSAFNMTNASPVNVVEWDEQIPAGCGVNCTIKVQIRTAPDSGGSPGAWTSWYGPSGAGTYFTVAKGALVPVILNDNQWVQYRVELAGDGTYTPSLKEIRINYK